MGMLMNCSIGLSIVILIYIAITPLLSKRYSAKGLYYTWLIIIIGLLVPVKPKVYFRIPGVTILREKMLHNSILAKTDLPITITEPSIVKLPINNTVTPIYRAKSAFISQNVDWWNIITIIWLVGVIAFLLFNAIKHYKFARMIHRWSEEIADKRTVELVQKIKRELSISREIGLYLCPCIGSPMLTGLFSPRILLPIITDMPQLDLYFILKHEFVHYKRKDLWYKCLLLIVTAMHWFNPVVHLMVRAIKAQCEISCDAEVVKSADISTRYRYSTTIIDSLKVQSKFKIALATNFYVGGKNSMKNRILSIMDTRKKKVSLIIICIVLVMSAGVSMANIGSIPVRSMEEGIKIRLRDNQDVLEEFSCYANSADSVNSINNANSVNNVDARPGLEFYIEGENIGEIEISCKNEYLYAVDWTGTQQEKYWNMNCYQTYDEETKTSTFYSERLYDKSMTFKFDEDFRDYGEIWYRWTARNLYEWAAKDEFSHFLGYGIKPKVQLSNGMTEEQKLKLVAGDDGSGITGLGHIQLDGYPKNLTKDRITIKIKDRDGNTITKYIDIKISNNKYNETVVTANLKK